MNDTNRLIIKYLSKDASPEEQAVLLEWLEADEENRIYFRSIKDTYDLGRIKADQENSRTHDQWTKFVDTVSATTRKSVQKRRIYAWMRYAAIFMAGIGLSYLAYTYTHPAKEEASLAVTKLKIA